MPKYSKSSESSKSSKTPYSRPYCPNDRDSRRVQKLLQTQPELHEALNNAMENGSLAHVAHAPPPAPLMRQPSGESQLSGPPPASAPQVPGAPTHRQRGRVPGLKFDNPPPPTPLPDLLRQVSLSDPRGMFALEGIASGCPKLAASLQGAPVCTSSGSASSGSASLAWSPTCAAPHGGMSAVSPHGAMAAASAFGGPSPAVSPQCGVFAAQSPVPRARSLHGAMLAASGFGGATCSSLSVFSRTPSLNGGMFAAPAFGGASHAALLMAVPRARSLREMLAASPPVSRTTSQRGMLAASAESPSDMFAGCDILNGRDPFSSQASRE